MTAEAIAVFAHATFVTDGRTCVPLHQTNTSFYEMFVKEGGNQGTKHNHT